MQSSESFHNRPRLSEDYVEEIKKLELINLENDSEAAETQSHNYKKENKELRERLEAVQECFLCCEYLY